MIWVYYNDSEDDFEIAELFHALIFVIIGRIFMFVLLVDIVRIHIRPRKAVKKPKSQPDFFVCRQRLNADR